MSEVDDLTNIPLTLDKPQEEDATTEAQSFSNHVLIHEKEATENSEMPEQLIDTDISHHESISIPLKDASTQATTLSHDVSVQVNTVFQNQKFMSFIQDDLNLSAWTGLESFTLLNCIVKCVKVKVGDKFDKGQILNTVDRIVLTFIKLKLSLPYQNNATLFHKGSKYTQTVFSDTVKLLRACLEPVAIKWTTREEVSRNLPKCFKGFEDVRVVLDCTEINIQRPANLCCQILTYSHYKGGLTLKFLTGVTPAGNISFISKVYGRRVSDTQIFAQSELKNLLQPEDAIMVDRGFLIEEERKKNNWKLIRPPFFKDKKQFSKEEMLLSVRVAAARVHIERSNQRLKNFKILSTKLPSVLLNLAEDIFVVISATVNLGAPILSRDKFFD